MNTETTIHGVKKIERSVRVHNDGKDSQFVVVSLKVTSVDRYGHESENKLVLFVEDGADISDLLGAEFELERV